jgi:hypothetical protein
MAKKPRLTLVDEATPTVQTPPATLGKTGKTLWQSIMSEYRIEDAGGKEMLKQICEAADNVAEYSAIIADDGAVIRTKTGPRDHPLVKHALAARSFVVRSLHRLGLDVEPIGRVGRPTLHDQWAED